MSKLKQVLTIVTLVCLLATIWLNYNTACLLRGLNAR